jgi:hypothetical protein
MTILSTPCLPLSPPDSPEYEPEFRTVWHFASTLCEDYALSREEADSLQELFLHAGLPFTITVSTELVD